MALQQHHAWIAFGLAAVCVAIAIVYALWENRKASKAQPMSVESPSFEQPVYVPNEPVAPVKQVRMAASPPPPPASPASPGLPPASRLVQVYPGGWVWNPYWHDRFHRDHRYGGKWQDHWDWRWGRDHWDNDGRHPWERGPIDHKKDRRPWERE